MSCRSIIVDWKLETNIRKDVFCTLVNHQCIFLMFIACFQVPTIFDKQGARLLAVVFLVVSRTWVSDRIASLNGILLSLTFRCYEIIFIMALGICVLRYYCEACFGAG